jgi:hypothetical protein
MRLALLFAAKLAVSAALLAFILRRVPLDAALDAARALPVSAAGLAVVLYFAAHGINAVKLRLFLPELSLAQALRFTLIALFYGTVLPGQLAGDAVKALRLMRIAAGGDAGRAAAAVAVDKIVGLFALLVLTALGLGLEAGTMGLAAARLAFAVLLAAALGFALLVLLPAPAWLGRWGRAFAAWRAARLQPSVLLTALAFGFLFNLLSIGVFVVLGQALGLHLGLAAWAVVMGLVSLALLLPVTVAGVGLRETSLVALLVALGQNAGGALALSLALLALTLFGAVAGALADLAGRDRP